MSVSNLSFSPVLRIVVILTIMTGLARTCLSQENSVNSDNGAGEWRECQKDRGWSPSHDQYLVRRAEVSYRFHNESHSKECNDRR